jgi:PAS domain S-box-containing protein
MRGAMLDVTEAREAERDRLAAVTLFRHGFDAAPIGMGLTDPAGAQYIRVNDAMCRLLGRTREQLIGESVEALTHPEDRVRDQGGREAMLAGTVSSFEADKRYLRPDGSAVWTTLHVAPVRNADGSVQAFFSQLIDITERKDREAHFEQEVNDALWLGRIRDALDDDRLVLYRQPIVDLRTGETVQQELLLRMLGEDGSIVAPGEFLPIAERYGLISEIDRWVLRQAVNLAARGQPTEFNLSAASIGDPDILRELASAIEETGADPALLVLEVTETAMMNQLDAGRRFAQQVAALGCQLALDDFGTGFASLSYLKQSPAQHLKIDIEFVRDLIRSETDERLVRGIIGIAREFDQTTIAEGIEDEATLVRLRELGVHLGQGYLFGRPAPLADAAPSCAPGSTPSDHPAPGSDPVTVVRSAFAAFARRDVDAMLQSCHPDVVLRPYHETSDLTGRRAPYRGHDGIRAYVRDIDDVWKSLKLTPTAFRAANESVIVFGRAEADSGADTRTLDALWVWRLRDDLVVSVEVFQSAAPNPAQRARTPPAAKRRPAAAPRRRAST